MSDYRKCPECGSTVPVKETVPPSGFVDWDPVDVSALRGRLATAVAELEGALACDFDTDPAHWRDHARHAMESALRMIRREATDG